MGRYNEEIERIQRRRRRQRRRQAGMTLIEIMIVMVIMALVAAGAGFAILPQMEKAKIKQTATDAKTIAAAAELYIVDNGDCPSVQALVDAKILKKSLNTQDSWDNDYQVECDDDGATVRSAGPDKQFGTEDDIEG